MENLINLVERRLALTTLANAVNYLNLMYSRDAYADYEAVKILERKQFDIIRGSL